MISGLLAVALQAVSPHAGPVAASPTVAEEATPARPPKAHSTKPHSPKAGALKRQTTLDGAAAQRAAKSTVATTSTTGSRAKKKLIELREPEPIPDRMVERRLTAFRRELGKLTPKSVVASGEGFVFAQNMIYNHSVTVFDVDGNRITDLSDEVPRELLGLAGKGMMRGAPVEAAVSADGKSLFVSNYYIAGKGFPANVKDKCKPEEYKHSYVYEIDIGTLEIVRAFKVGSAPKFLATTQDGKRLLVTNWCDFTLSVVDLTGDAETVHLKVGSFPRGIAIEPDAKTAYVASMGRNRVAVVDLETLTVARWLNPGKGPRHLLLHPDGRLFVTLSSEGSVAIVDKQTGEAIERVRVGKVPRSMAFSDDGTALYVANYREASLAVVDTTTLKIVQKIATGPWPIGVTFEPVAERVWVSCYGGSVRLYDSRGAEPHKSVKYIAEEAKRFPP